MKPISEADLIINADGSIYHLNLLPGDIADTVITVGDPDRVGEVSKYFDSIELKKGKREFITHTGIIGGKRITVLSTGIGTDNIDIVFNELDALVNINFETRMVNADLKKLNLIRIGTSGAIQADLEVDSLLASSAAFGLDSLAGFYQQRHTQPEKELLAAFAHEFKDELLVNPYYAAADEWLLQKLAPGIQTGITITAPGFYSPQGRQVRAVAAIPGLMEIISSFRYGHQRITNLEMETAGIYCLAKILGHRAISFNVILANRAGNVFSKQPAVVMDKYIKHLIEKISHIL
ncbi:nucleoside phosphorylase [Mucilaginibacter glaciei]|uniref:Nucleoside phosphorylase n=1 Tax=Mucilaginibacter glaciei TaxID=2772109 RepID=A0A926S0W3_9SPHI|nr:nucleoside phosphorylase [Mucilaginibacter glaciei]MBD1392423.1 nucleoside phosphorylase [Mucilaginibacter glaciei]